MSSLGDRMKEYERVPQRDLIKRIPVIIRCDGQAFHTFTKGMEKPFDWDLINSMDVAALLTARDIQGCVAFHVQSDEVSFLLRDDATPETQGWFGFRQSKMETLAASRMAVHFSAEMGRSAFFDARAFNLPESELPNYFLWRVRDWNRNSLSMLCRKYYSHKELEGKGRYEQHELLYKKDDNWALLPSRLKNGLFVDNTHDKVMNDFLDSEGWNYNGLKKALDKICFV